jgi:acetyl/propionyl-CoA carboxylase alpha subunit
VLGPGTIRPFLVDALRQPVFAAGEATTLFLSETWPGGWLPRPVNEATRNAVAAAIWLTARKPVQAAGPWRALSGFRLLAPAGRPATTHLSLSVAGQATRLVAETHGDVLRVTGSGGMHEVAIRSAGPDAWTVTIDGASTQAAAVCDADGVFLRQGGFEGRVGIMLAVEAAAAERGASGESGDSVCAAMPGTVAALHVAEGDRVKAGQIVVVLESMKLFMELKSPATGTVKRLGAKAGETVAAGDMLVAIEPD